MRASALPGSQAEAAMLKRISSRMRSARSIWTQVYAYVAIAFMSGALNRPLAGGPSLDGENAESPAIQIFGALLMLIAGLMTGRQLLYRPKTIPLHVTTIGLILGLICAWVLMSIGWSAFPDKSFRRGVAFVGTVLVGWALATNMPRDQLLRAFGRASVFFIALSGLIAIVSPTYAFHQASDPGNPEHAGLMRGTFAHKNEFARMIALALLLIIAAGKSSFGKRWPAFLALIVGSGLLVLAGSAKVMIAVPIAVFGAVVMRYCKTPFQRLVLMVFVALPAAIMMYTGALDLLISQVFSELGRDESMSGRDEIWAEAERWIVLHWQVGQGYAAGWAAGPQSQGHWLQMQHAHNGYLQTLLDIGLVGLVLSLAPLAYILWDTIFPGRKRSRALDYLSISFAALFLIVNIVGSYLTSYNDIYTLLLVCLALWISQDRRNYRLARKRRRLHVRGKQQASGQTDSPAVTVRAESAGQ